MSRLVSFIFISVSFAFVFIPRRYQDLRVSSHHKPSWEYPRKRPVRFRGGSCADVVAGRYKYRCTVFPPYPRGSSVTATPFAARRLMPLPDQASRPPSQHSDGSPHAAGRNDKLQVITPVTLRNGGTSASRGSVFVAHYFSLNQTNHLVKTQITKYSTGMDERVPKGHWHHCATSRQ